MQLPGYLGEEVLLEIKGGMCLFEQLVSGRGVLPDGGKSACHSSNIIGLVVLPSVGIDRQTMSAASLRTVLCSLLSFLLVDVTCSVMGLDLHV